MKSNVQIINQIVKQINEIYTCPTDFTGHMCALENLLMQAHWLYAFSTCQEKIFADSIHILFDPPHVLERLNKNVTTSTENAEEVDFIFSRWKEIGKRLNIRLIVDSVQQAEQ